MTACQGTATSIKCPGRRGGLNLAGPPFDVWRKSLGLLMANPLRSGDAKLEVSGREIARPPASRHSSQGGDNDGRSHDGSSYPHCRRGGAWFVRDAGSDVVIRPGERALGVARQLWQPTRVPDVP